MIVEHVNMGDAFAEAVILGMIAVYSFVKAHFVLLIWITGPIRNAIIVPDMVNDFSKLKKKINISFNNLINTL